jgi:uncharacterized protein YdaU (DUF1376 family)
VGTSAGRNEWWFSVNYFPFHVGDYAAHTGHLEPMEDLAYRRLLDQYYLREGPLPADIAATAKLIRMRSMQDDVESVLREFFTLTDGGWVHARCEQEIEKMKDKQAKARASACASVAARQAKAERSFTKPPADVKPTLPKEQTDAELPTPTPTPTPTPKEEREESIAKGGAGGKVQPRGARLTTDWAPDSRACEDAREAGLPTERIPLEAAKFRDYWAAQPGQKGVKADWPATWRNWCRKAAEQVPRVATGPPNWRERQLETAALMTGATRSTQKPQPETVDVESRIIPARCLG